MKHAMNDNESLLSDWLVAPKGVAFPVRYDMIRGAKTDPESDVGEIGQKAGPIPSARQGLENRYRIQRLFVT